MINKNGHLFLCVHCLAGQTVTPVHYSVECIKYTREPVGPTRKELLYSGSIFQVIQCISCSVQSQINVFLNTENVII